MDCGTLRSEKWKACHPTNEPKVGHPRCEAGMTYDELKRIYDAHNMCLSFRQLENQSNCFSNKDPGHRKAEIHEEQESMICLSLLQNYKEPLQVQSPKTPQKKKTQTPLTPQTQLDEIDEDLEEESDTEFDEFESEETEGNDSLWKQIGKGLLILLAVVVLLFFIRYVV